MLRQILVASTLLLCMSAMPMCCGSNTAPTSGSGEFEKASVPVGVTYKVLPGDPKRVEITNTTGSHIKGCIVFTDEAGNVVSQTPGTIAAGGTMTVFIPAGATGQHVTDEEDCEPGAPGAPGPFTARASMVRRELFHQEIRLVPNLGGAPNLETYITGAAAVAGNFYQDARRISREGYRTPFQLSPGVAALDALLSEVVVLPGFDLRLTLASNQAFQSIELWINGSFVMDMNAAVPASSVAAGWSAWSFGVPADASALNYDPMPGASWENSIEFRFTRLGDSVGSVLRRTIEYTTN